MYLPVLNRQSDPAQTHRLIAEHPLGAWVVGAAGGLVANHIPFFLVAGPADGDGGLPGHSASPGTLHAHVARANPVWHLLRDDVQSLVMFQGPQAYISPAWYPAKAEHGKVVPTWNYAVVQAEGTARAIHDRDWLHAHVARLTALQESGRAEPWQVTDAPADYIERMVDAIVGIEITLRSLTGKWKVSQNRPLADRVGVARGLRQEAREAEQVEQGEQGEQRESGHGRADKGEAGEGFRSNARAHAHSHAYAHAMADLVAQSSAGRDVPPSVGSGPAVAP